MKIFIPKIFPWFFVLDSMFIECRCCHKECENADENLKICQKCSSSEWCACGYFIKNHEMENHFQKCELVKLYSK